MKREDAIEGPFVAEARLGSGPTGEHVVEFALTPEAADRLAALTRTNIGQRLAIVVNGKVVVNTLIAGEAPVGPLMIDGKFTEAEARALAAEMRELSRSAKE